LHSFLFFCGFIQPDPGLFFSDSGSADGTLFHSLSIAQRNPFQYPDENIFFLFFIFHSLPFLGFSFHEFDSPVNPN